MNICTIFFGYIMAAPTMSCFRIDGMTPNSTGRQWQMSRDARAHTYKLNCCPWQMNHIKRSRIISKYREMLDNEYLHYFYAWTAYIDLSSPALHADSPLLLFRKWTRPWIAFFTTQSRNWVSKFVVNIHINSQVTSVHTHRRWTVCARWLCQANARLSGRRQPPLVRCPVVPSNRYVRW